MPTTTSAERNLIKLNSVFSCLSQNGSRAVTVIDVGPGAAVSFLTNFLKKPATSAPFKQRVRFSSARNIEAVMRRVPMVPLVSFEPREIILVASAHNIRIQKLIIVDAFECVQKAINRISVHLTVPFCFVNFNLESDKLWMGPKADVVCAYRTVERCKYPGESLKHVASMVRPGGLLSTTTKIRDNEFEAVEIGKGLYQKS